MQVEDYSEILRAHELFYRVREPWFIVGDGERKQGWKLHLSSIQADAPALLGRTLPRLRASGEHFKVARNARVLGALNSGELGETQVGKFVCIYPRSDGEARRLALDLIGLTEGLRGPAVPSDMHLGAVVYARYGSFDPLIVRDRLGNATRCIYGRDGKLRPDHYHLPFVLDEDVDNPFTDFAPQAARPGPGLLGPGYRAIGVIRGKTTGSVFLALDLRSQEQVSLKILKQARPHAHSDEYGRDLRDRLRHQAAVHHALAKLSCFPKAEEYFEIDGTGYLAIEYVEGESAESIADRTLAGGPWSSLDGERRERLLDIVHQFLVAVQAMHEAGYVHRDLAASNVWVSTDGRVYLFDLELAHRVTNSEPPFSMGTAGFMSPQQEKGVRPSVADDVYSAACVLTLLLTGLDPRRIVFDGADLAARLSAYMAVPESALHRAIAACTEREPERRSGISELIRAVDRERLVPGTGRQTSLPASRVEQVLEAGLRGLLNAPRDHDSNLWLSPSIPQDRHGWAQRWSFEVRRDANRGVAGAIYVLARLARFGFVVDPDTVAGVVPWLIGSEATDLPGLHFGRAGVAVALAEAVAGGLVERSSVRQFVREALEGRLDWLDITHGASGQGIAAMCCGDALGDPDLTRLSQRCAEYLLNTQNPDGSWTTPEGADGISGETLTGFAHGVAGMVYFLAGYSARTRNIDAGRAAEKGAHWLLSQADRTNGIITWQYSNRDRTRWHWWCHGGPGIALAFLKLFEVTGEPAYADVARAALNVHPANRRHPNLSVCHGLAGLGEIYLDAVQILKDEEWQHRAQQLAELLIALARTNDDGSLGWIVEDPHVPTADLMVGSGGVMHFLLRVHTGGHIGGFPLLLGAG